MNSDNFLQKVAPRRGQSEMRTVKRFGKQVRSGPIMPNEWLATGKKVKLSDPGIRGGVRFSRDLLGNGAFDFRIAERRKRYFRMRERSEDRQEVRKSANAVDRCPVLPHGSTNATVLCGQRDDRDRLREVRVRCRSRQQLQVILANVVVESSGLKPRTLARAGAKKLWFVEITERDGGATCASDEQVGGIRAYAALDPVERLESTYSAAADLGGWDRAALECETGVPRRPRSL
jgi:hypothetical protein